MGEEFLPSLSSSDETLGRTPASMDPFVHRTGSSGSPLIRRRRCRPLKVRKAASLAEGIRAARRESKPDIKPWRSCPNLLERYEEQGRLQSSLFRGKGPPPRKPVTQLAKKAFEGLARVQTSPSYCRVKGGFKPATIRRAGGVPLPSEGGGQPGPDSIRLVLGATPCLEWRRPLMGRPPEQPFQIPQYGPGRPRQTKPTNSHSS